PEVLERPELGEPRQTVLRRLGHLHLVCEEAPVAVARVDPEAFRRLLGEEPRRLIAGRAAEEEARAEANWARAGRDEVRQVSEARKVAVPPFARDELGEGRLGGHERPAAPLDPGGDRWITRVDRVTVSVAREEDPALLEELPDGGHPEGERGRGVVTGEDRLGVDARETAAAGDRRRRAVLWIDLAAGERVVAAEELHGPPPADHVDLDRLRRPRRCGAHEHDGRRGLRLHGRHGRAHGLIIIALGIISGCPPYGGSGAFERGLRPRNRILGEASEGAVAGPLRVTD